MDIINLMLEDFTKKGSFDIKIAAIRDIVNRFTNCTKEGITVIGPIAAIPNNDGTYTLRDLRHGWGYMPLDLEYEGKLTEDAIKAFLKSTVNKYRNSANQMDKIIRDFYKD